MRHKFLVLTVKKWFKSVYIYRSFREIKTGISLFWTTLYCGITTLCVASRGKNQKMFSELLSDKNMMPSIMKTSV